MTSRAELWAELDRAAHQLSPDHIAHLVTLGVPLSTLAKQLPREERSSRGLRSPH